MFEYLKQYYITRDIKEKQTMGKVDSVISQAIIKGNFQILKFIFKEVIGAENIKDYFDKFGSDLLFVALNYKSKSLEIIKYLNFIQSRFKKIDEDSYFSYYIDSPETGNLEIVKWFDNKTPSLKYRKLSIPVLSGMFSRAISSGSADIFTWLLEKKPSFDFNNLSDTWVPAIESGSVDLLNCMISNEQLSEIFDRDTLFVDGIKYGHRHVIEWLYQQNCTIDSYSTYYDLDNHDNPDFIEWIFQFFTSIEMEDVNLFSNSIDWYCYYTKERCSLERERLNKERRTISRIIDPMLYGKVIMNSTFDHALLHGNFNIFKWLHTNQVDEQCSPYFLNLAHYRNDIEFAVWLFENRTESCTLIFDRFWETNIDMKTFIIYNYSELLPPDVLEIGQNGYVQLQSYELFEYIVTNHPHCISLKSLITACRLGNIDLVKIIHNTLFKDYPISNNNQHLSISEIKTVQHQALKEAFNYSPLEVTQFLFENAVIPIEGHLNYKDYLMDFAISLYSVKLIKYLHNNTVCKLNPASSKMILKRKLYEDDIRSLKALRKKRAANEPTLKKYKYNYK